MNECSELLESIEAEFNAIHPDLLRSFKEEYSRRGGEQFRPNPDKVQCRCPASGMQHSLKADSDPTREQVFETLKNGSKKLQGSQTAAYTLLLLADAGIDLDQLR